MTDYLEIGGHGRMGFTSHGGGIHHSAIIGQAPEHRDLKLGHHCYPVEIHHTARIEALVTIDAGMYRPTHVGARSWFMKQTHAGHDVIVGEDCEIAPGSVLGGSVELGDGVKVGINATILPFVKIGAGARIGAGAVVTKNVPAGEVWAGNPARQLITSDRPAFWERVDKESDPNGCWLWTGVENQGYGCWNGKKAHRVSYKIAHGSGSIPMGFVLDHLCRNTICVNPDHLEPVTHAENLRRGANGVLKTHCKRGHPWVPENIYTSPKGKRHCKVCNRESARKLRSVA